MNWVEQRRNRTPGEYGSHYPPKLAIGHVTYTISPFRQKTMKGVFTEFIDRMIISGPRKLAILSPAIILYVSGHIFVNSRLKHEHHAKYW